MIPVTQSKLKNSIINDTKYSDEAPIVVENIVHKPNSCNSDICIFIFKKKNFLLTILDVKTLRIAFFKIFVVCIKKYNT